MGRIIIYRLTAIGDTINNVNDMILFNIAKDTKSVNAFITRVTKGGQTAIGDQQSAGQPTSNLQPLDKIEDLYTFYGFISKLNDQNGENALANILVGWDNDSVKVNDSWRQGRFGVQFDDIHGLDVVPANKNSNNQIGLIWQNLTWDLDWTAKPMQGKFVLTMKVSRSNGT